MDYKKPNSFKEFYPYYLAEHSDSVNRILHFVGTWIVIIAFISAIITGNLVWLWLCPLAGYGFAWVGHFFFEDNRPATFKHPFYSLAGDFAMWWHLLTRRINF